MKANIEVEMFEPNCAALDFFPFEGLAKIAHSKKLLPTFYIADILYADCSSSA